MAALQTFLVIAGVTFIVLFLGGGAFFWLYLKTRPKKVTWIAKCYQLGEGVIPEVKDKKGRIISDLQLNDMKPYATDTLERKEIEHGVTIHRLVKQNLSTGAVTADHVDNWGEGKNEVNVLIHKGQATILKKGYDTKTGNAIFRPMPRERIELLKSEIATKKERLNKEKDILQAITPWIVTGILVLGMVAIAYFHSKGLIESSKNNKDAAQLIADADKQRVEREREMLIEVFGQAEQKTQLGIQDGKEP